MCLLIRRPVNLLQLTVNGLVNGAKFQDVRLLNTDIKGPIHTPQYAAK